MLEEASQAGQDVQSTARMGAGIRPSWSRQRGGWLAEILMKVIMGGEERQITSWGGGGALVVGGAA